MSPIRISYQSYVDYEDGKIYWDRLRAHLAQIADPGTVIDVRGITPHDSYAHPIVEFRCAREVICNAITAEEQGYDALLIGLGMRVYTKRARWSTSQCWRVRQAKRSYAAR